MSSYSEKPDTIPKRSDDAVETVKLNSDDIAEIFERDPSQVPAHASFWCISLTLVDSGVQMVINISGSVVLGRYVEKHHDETFIDLSGYKGHEFGVSRKHAIIRLRDNIVVIKDNNSANRTLLNSKKLPPLQEYPLKPGDVISLGKLQLKFDLIFDPFA